MKSILFLVVATVLFSGCGKAYKDEFLNTIRGMTDAQAKTFNGQYQSNCYELKQNGSSVYVDLGHLELAQSETWSAFDFVAHGRAMLTVARDALDRTNGKMPDGCRVVALANCSDGLGHSYGAHMNVLLSRTAWENICIRKPHYLAYLAAFQASSCPMCRNGPSRSGISSPCAATIASASPTRSTRPRSAG